MRFLMGALGGIVCALVVALAVAGVSLELGHGASQPFRVAAAVLLAFLQESSRPGYGFLLYLAIGAVLGGMFTSVMCGKVATGPAVGIGLVYGFGIYVVFRFAVLPIFSPDLSSSLSSTTLLGRSLLFGALMGVWVITVSHIWPRLTIKCE